MYLYIVTATVKPAEVYDAGHFWGARLVLPLLVHLVSTWLNHNTQRMLRT